MRLLLVQTPSGEVFSAEKVYHIGIVSLAGHLRAAGHEVPEKPKRPAGRGLKSATCTPPGKTWGPWS